MRFLCRLGMHNWKLEKKVICNMCQRTLWFAPNKIMGMARTYKCECCSAEKGTLSDGSSEQAFDIDYLRMTIKALN